VKPRPDEDNWLVRPSSIRLLWRILWVVLALTVAADFFIKPKPYFSIEGWYGFAAGFGFLACVLMVLVAKALGVFLKRDQDYYREREDD
jgi:hypothetical protein